MNPFTMGPLAMSAWSNPDLFATAMATQGVSPSQVLGGGGELGMAPVDPIAAFLTPSANGAGTAPQAAAPTPMDGWGGAQKNMGGFDPIAALGSFGKVTPPPAAPAPLMNAGVSGAQKAPEVQVGSVNNMQNAIIKMLLNARGGQQGPGVPGLPGLVKGI